MHDNFLIRKLKERKHFEDRGVDWRMILKRISKKEGVIMQSEYMWLK
jgi:hypothetical protein